MRTTCIVTLLLSTAQAFSPAGVSTQSLGFARAQSTAMFSSPLDGMNREMLNEDDVVPMTKAEMKAAEKDIAMTNDEVHANTPSSSTVQPSYRLHGDKRQIVRPANSDGDDNLSNQSRATSLLLFSNDRIKVSDFRLGPSQTAKCKHDYPTVRWQVAYDGVASQHNVKITNTADAVDVKDAPPSGIVVDRQAYSVDEGTTWEITNTSKETDYRQIVFELLSNKPKYTEKEVQDMFAMAKYSTDVGTELVFENELCRCWDFYLDPSEGGGVDTVHHHCLDYVFINVAPSRLLGLHPETLSLEVDGLLFDSVSEDNQVTWNSIPRDAGTDIAFAHGGKNGYDDRPMREYLIELK